MHKQQVGTTNPTPHQVEDIDMQLETCTPEHNGSLLQLSTSQKFLTEDQLQAADKERKIIHLAENTPMPSHTKSPRMGDTSHTHRAKK